MRATFPLGVCTFTLEYMRCAAAAAAATSAAARLKLWFEVERTLPLKCGPCPKLSIALLLPPCPMLKLLDPNRGGEEAPLINGCTIKGCCTFTHVTPGCDMLPHSPASIVLRHSPKVTTSAFPSRIRSVCRAPASCSSFRRSPLILYFSYEGRYKYSNTVSENIQIYGVNNVIT